MPLLLVGRLWVSESMANDHHRDEAYANRSAASSSRSTPTATGSHLTPTSRHGSRLRDSLLDPQLDRRVKEESLSRPATPNVPFNLNTADLNRHFAPQMQQWVDSPFAEAPLVLKQESPETTPSDFGLFDPRPTATLVRRDFSGVPSESFMSYIDEEFDAVDPVADSLLPKGVQWPGMAMFDSATPEMKRKRNQKKSTSVLKQLQATSEVIEPNELVFDASGTFRKKRTITGEPDSSDSLIEGESEPDIDVQERKRPKRRPRAALVEKNVNTNRPFRQRALPRPLSILPSHGPYFDGVDEDEDLTYGAHQPVKRRGISIHRDNTGPDITFEQPGFGLLTAPFRPGNRAEMRPSQNARLNAIPRVQLRMPSWETFGQLGSLGSIGNPYTGHNPAYETFGQFINLGHPSNTLTTGYHAQTTYSQPCGANFGSLTVDQPSYPTADTGDTLADLFNYSHDITPMTANPLLGLSAAPEPSHTNPLFLDRTERDEDEATISVTSEN